MFWRPSSLFLPSAVSALLCTGCFSEPPPTEDAGSSSSAAASSSEATGADTQPETTAAESSSSESGGESSGFADNAVVVYSTSATFTGDLEAQGAGAGVLAFVDAACAQEPAYARASCSEAVALLEFPGNPAVMALPEGEYVTADNVPFANSKADFFAGVHVDTLEDAGVFPQGTEGFWTGAGPNGGDCMGWTSQAGEGWMGSTNTNGGGWLFAGERSTCSAERPLLCVCTQ